MNLPINQTGKRIQNYIFNYSDFLGAGNFSKCYKGYNHLTGDIVAIKIVELNSLTSKKLEQLLFQQIQILKKLNHPSVLRCYEIFTSNRNCYIITQLCNQGNLQTQLQLKKTFDQTQANSIIKDVYEGLVYLAQNNIVHRDLKTANIFLHNGKAKIADFGFAKQINHNFNDLNIGSPLYMSPQGILHNLYGPKTEVWALGIFVYQLFHGSSPYINCKTQEQLKRIISIPLNWNQLRTDLSQDIKQFILTCLQINEQKRASIEQLANLSYIRRLKSTIQPYKNHDLRSTSKSFHSVQKSFQFQQQKINTNMNQHNNQISRNYSVTKNNDKSGLFKSVDMKGNYRHSTQSYQSPKKNSIYGQVNRLNLNNPVGKIQTINLMRPNNTSNSNFINNPVNIMNLNNQPPYQGYQFPLMQQTQQSIRMFQNPSMQINGQSKRMEQNQNRSNSLNKNNYLNPNSPDRIGYGQGNQFRSSGQPETNTSKKNILSQKNIFAPKLGKEKETVTKNIRFLGDSFQGNIHLKEGIFFIHHYRLIFKFLCLYRETSYFEKQLYLEAFQYILCLLQQLHNLAQAQLIVAQGQKSRSKIQKFKQVNIQYQSKYTKQLNENNYTLLPQQIKRENIQKLTYKIQQLLFQINQNIDRSRHNNLVELQQNLIVIGHLCVVIVGSLKQIYLAVQRQSFRKLLDFKLVQIVLNTPKEQFTINSYDTYRRQIFL